MSTYLDNLAKKLNTQDLAIQAEGFSYDEDDFDSSDITGGFDIDEAPTEKAVTAQVETKEPVSTPVATPEPINKELDARESLHAFELDAFNKEKKSKLEALNAAYFREESALVEKHREETGKTLEGSLKRSLLQSRQIGERLTLKDTFESQSAAIESVQFPDYETWELADYKSGTHFGELASANSKRLPVPTDIRAFKSKEIKGEVAYYKAEFLKRPRVNFADDGHKVKVYLVDDEQTILAALQLASQKELGKPFDIKGSKSFCELCQSVALAHGIAIKTPEIVGSKTVQKTQLIESEPVAEPVH